MLLSEDTEDGHRFADEFRWFRGGAVSTFAQIEYSIAHLLLRLHDRSDIVTTSLSDLPYSAGARTRKLRAICEASQNLQEFVVDAVTIDKNFEKLALVRNFLAHGFARIDVAASEVLIRKFSPTKQDTWNVEIWTLPRAEMPERYRQIELFGELVWEMVQRTNQRFQLNF